MLTYLLPYLNVLHPVISEPVCLKRFARFCCCDVFFVSVDRFNNFLPREATICKRVSAVFVVVRCLSVCHVGVLYPDG